MLRRLLVLLTAALLAAAWLGGCASSGDGLSQHDKDKSNRAEEIIKKSGGNWDAVSKEDKDYLIKEIGYGNETNAKMFFLAESGQLHKGPTKK